MNKSEIMQHVREAGIVRVIRAQSLDKAMRVIDAVREGGISRLEVTKRCRARQSVETVGEAHRAAV